MINSDPHRSSREMQVAVIDIGKPGKNLGWALVGTRSAEGTDLDQCIEVLADALRTGPMALGFEAPMFVPKRDEPARLLCARAGECGGGTNRPFSASAGASSLVSGLVICLYVLQVLRTKVPSAAATFNWRSPPNEPGELLLFEAFVTNQRKTSAERHVEDARLAAKTFKEKIANPVAFESSISEDQTMNLLGASLLRSGWTTNASVISEPCLVVRG